MACNQSPTHEFMRAPAIVIRKDGALGRIPAPSVKIGV
jgi:hypothetical protein